MPTGNYYARDRPAQHAARVHSRARAPPPGKDGLTPQKTAIKALADGMFHTTYETSGGVFDRREGEYHERTIADKLFGLIPTDRRLLGVGAGYETVQPLFILGTDVQLYCWNSQNSRVAA
jgi:hypothetical protein